MIDEIVFPVPVSSLQLVQVLSDRCDTMDAVGRRFVGECVYRSLIDGEGRDRARIMHYNAIKICDFRQR